MAGLLLTIEKLLMVHFNIYSQRCGYFDSGTNEIHEGTSSKRRKNNDGNNGDLDKVNTSKTKVLQVAL